MGKYFGDLDDWRNRFIRLRTLHRKPLELCGHDKLSRWLLRPPKDPPVNLWERGNRWVINMATTSDAKCVTLLALWDKKEDRGPGGIEHMMKLAREAGTIEVDIMDTEDAYSPSPVTVTPHDGSVTPTEQPSIVPSSL